MGVWDKLRTGRVTRPCEACGRRLTISRWAIPAVILPIAIGAFIADRAASLTIGSLAIAVGAAVAVLLLVFAVPVVERDE